MKISQQKRDKISEQILSHLYHNFPKSFFTAEIAREIARDEEFIKNLLNELNSKDLVFPIKKNNQGVQFLKRTKWRISNKAQQAYKNLN
ncbi:MAG: hypothetical protein KKF56_01170 [Nanoarchaeota archaeon]|nr:hypothetical protein [Nanoarchaeota archaeon]